jgi:hypothetical protein
MTKENVGTGKPLSFLSYGQSSVADMVSVPIANGASRISGDTSVRTLSSRSRISAPEQLPPRMKICSGPSAEPRVVADHS